MNSLIINQIKNPKNELTFLTHVVNFYHQYLSGTYQAKIDYHLLLVKRYIIIVCFIYAIEWHINVTKYKQWRIYIEAKEPMLGGLRTQGAPQIYIKRLWNNDNTFNKITAY